MKSVVVMAAVIGIAGHVHPPARPVPTPVTAAQSRASSTPPPARVNAAGVRFVRDGQPFAWQGASAFGLVDLVADGHADQAEAFVAALPPTVTVLRIFVTAKYLFQLSPEEGRAALPATLALLGRHQRYAEVVALADTCPTNPGEQPCPSDAPDFDTHAHVAAVGAICAADAACLGVQVANEPDNRTQAGQVASAAFLCDHAALVPAPALVTLGPGGDETGPTSDAYARCPHADYATVHGARTTSEDGWHWVRRTREQQIFRDALGKPVVNDEPNRDEDPARNFGVAAIAKLFGLGDTIHLANLRDTQPLTAAERAAIDARVRAWALFPPGWVGRYSRATLVGDPVTAIDDARVLRSYSGLDGDRGYVAMVGVKPGGEASAVWGNGWQHAELAREGGAIVYRVWR